jgi:hypothetical protein
MHRKHYSHILAAVSTAALLFSGCATLNRFSGPLDRAATVLFTSATLSDLQVVGIKAGPGIPIKASGLGTSASIGQEPSQELSDILGQTSFGILVPITRVGETSPWWIFCPSGGLQKRCEEIPSNARVTFTGQPLGHSVIYLPTHLTWSAQ